MIQSIAASDATHGEDVPRLGCWSIVRSATIVEIAAQAGLDFIILDLEHGAHDIGDLEQAIRAAEGKGMAPFVRVPDLTASTFQRVLDLGAHGVVAPQVRTVADVEHVVRCCRFPPRGTRGYNPFTRAADYAAPAVAGQGKLAADFVTIAIIVETLEAYAALDEICAVPEVAVVYLGVYDMSLALGTDGDTSHPAVSAFVADAGARIRRAGKAVGLMVRSERAIDDALSLGATFLVWSVDSSVIYDAFRAPVTMLAERKAQHIRVPR